VRPGPKRWTRYAAYLGSGDWHVHSRWSSDAQGSIEEYCLRARAGGLKLVAFTEHVRRQLRYDYGAFVEEVERAREAFPDLVLLAGCEAKVLDVTGAIDAPDHVLDRADLVIGSFHSFAEPGRYVDALEAMLRHPRVDVWGHPTLYAVKKGLVLDPATQATLIDLCREREVLIEFNQKYQLPGPAMRELVRERGALHVTGSDAHRVEDLWSGVEVS
jgi:DNA polymerase (family 10)/putative hydrolase